MNPAIIIATKHIAAEQSLLETESHISHLPAEESIKTSAPLILEKKPYLEGDAESISGAKGSKEVKFPDLDNIKERLLLGYSTVVSESGDIFNIHSIFGIFTGFRTDQDFSLRTIAVKTSKDYNQPYELSGLLEVTFAEKTKIHLFLKSAYRHHIQKVT